MRAPFAASWELFAFNFFPFGSFLVKPIFLDMYIYLYVYIDIDIDYHRYGISSVWEILTLGIP